MQQYEIDEIEALEPGCKMVGYVEDIAIMRYPEPVCDGYYTFAMKEGNVWKSYGLVADTAHEAFLLALGFKADGYNSSFARYACRMLIAQNDNE